MLSILFGLTSAISWGAGDFTGGLAARRTGAYRAVFYGEFFGLILLLAAVVISPQPMPDVKSIILSIAAGALGTVGLMLLYSAMAQGKMSIAAPVSALLAAALPVIVGMITDGFPGYLTCLGFGFALAAIWLVSQSEDGVKDIFTHLSDLRLPLLAGVGFGLYFVLMNAATRQTTLWPMVYSRGAGLLAMALFILVRRNSFVTIRRGMSRHDSEWHSRCRRKFLLHSCRTSRPTRYFSRAQFAIPRFDGYTSLDHFERTLDAHTMAGHPVRIDCDYSFHCLRRLA